MKGLCKNIWLSAVLLLTMVLTLDSSQVLVLGHYGPPSTGRIQQLVYNTKLVKLLNKYNGDFWERQKLFHLKF